MEFWRSVGGMVELCLTCADLEGILGKLNQNGIKLYDIQLQSEISCLFQIQRTDYIWVKDICESSDAKIEKMRRKGIFWTLIRLLCRPVLLAGFLLYLFLVLFLPTRILFVFLEGNENVSDRRILEAAEISGIRFGASRREVRSEKVKNALLGTVPELQWAGINTRGCVAIISVRERTQEPENKQTGTVSHVVSAADGYILSATATRGTLQVQPGQSVITGQTLISGYSDLGDFLQVTAAEGEVFAQTHRKIEVITPAFWQIRRFHGEEMKKISLLIGKKRINLWKDSGISGISCGRMYEEYYVTLPGNFILPVAVCVETYIPDTRQIDSPEAYPGIEALEDYTMRYLRKQMVAGQILTETTHTTAGNDVFIMQKLCVCQEMIGRPWQEQIGVIHEQNN